MSEKIMRAMRVGVVRSSTGAFGTVMRMLGTDGPLTVGTSQGVQWVLSFDGWEATSDELWPRIRATESRHGETNPPLLPPGFDVRVEGTTQQFGGWVRFPPGWDSDLRGFERGGVPVVVRPDHQEPFIGMVVSVRPFTHRQLEPCVWAEVVEASPDVVSAVAVGLIEASDDRPSGVVYVPYGEDHQLLPPALREGLAEVARVTQEPEGGVFARVAPAIAAMVQNRVRAKDDESEEMLSAVVLLVLDELTVDSDIDGDLNPGDWYNPSANRASNLALAGALLLEVLTNDLAWADLDDDQVAAAERDLEDLAAAVTRWAPAVDSEKWVAAQIDRLFESDAERVAAQNAQYAEEDAKLDEDAGVAVTSPRAPGDPGGSFKVTREREPSSLETGKGWMEYRFPCDCGATIAGKIFQDPRVAGQWSSDRVVSGVEHDGRSYLVTGVRCLYCPTSYSVEVVVDDP